MKTYGEVFNELQTKLKQARLLPNEYFLLNSQLNMDSPMVNFQSANCTVNFGGSEGIYLEIDLMCRNAEKQLEQINFATGKTLGEQTYDFYKMSLAAGECSILLNGGGCRIEDNTKAILILDEADAEELGNAFRLQVGFNEALNKSNEIVYGLIEHVYRDEIYENEDELEDAL